ncbi:aminotransferase class V-fold PLP-dependent enzyme [Streptomyces sp. CA-106110]|uniref:aminotransferase class V-fold PLP-dependent enzyme n=1 Tax=Streptomyces sp. CA-106110 TaxID=3240044 RepID=UPI003D8D1284
MLQETLPDRLRHRFPVLDRLTYLNSCSQGALSDAVRTAYNDYLASLEREGSAWDHWVACTERLRAAYARLLNVDADEIAVTTSTSAGLNALASAMDFTGPRDTIVATDLEFPTVGQIWHAHERHGARIVHVPAEPDNTMSLERLASAIDERTALVSVTHVCFRNGSRLDLEAITRIAHERGALVLVDAYQSAGALPIDARALGVDFVVGGALKYLLASPGVAYLYANSATTSHLVPLATGWFADSDVFAMRIDRYAPSRSARRFEAGTPPIPAVYAAYAGVELMLEIGVEATAAHVERLNSWLIDELETMGTHVVTPKSPACRGPLVAVRSVDAEALVARLSKDGIVTSSRDNNLRIAAHCYNTTDDIERLLTSLRRNVDLMRAN